MLSSIAARARSVVVCRILCCGEGAGALEQVGSPGLLSPFWSLGSLGE